MAETTSITILTHVPCKVVRDTFEDSRIMSPNVSRRTQELLSFTLE